MEELQKLKRKNIILKIFIGLIIIYLIMLIIYDLYIFFRPSNCGLMPTTQQEIAIFNAQFTSSEGNNIRGTVAKSLLHTVITNNSLYDETMQISIIAEDENGNTSKYYTAEEISLLRNKIETNRRYNIALTYNENGYVYQIKITGHFSYKSDTENTINNTTNTNNSNNITHIYVRNIEN